MVKQIVSEFIFFFLPFFFLLLLYRSLFFQLFSFRFHYMYKSNIFSLFKRFSVVSLLEKIPTFHPTHIFRIIWDLLHLSMVIFLLFVIPVNVFFEEDLMESCGEARKVVGAFFLADEMVKLNTAYYLKVD